MVPFKVFNREKKEVWIVLNYQPGEGYLASREADDDQDGAMVVIPTDELVKLKMVEIMNDGDSYSE